MWYKWLRRLFFRFLFPFLNCIANNSYNRSKPRYGIEQEYTLLQPNVKWPLGWPVGGYPGPQVFTIFLNVTILLLCDYLKYKGWIVWCETGLYKTCVSQQERYNFTVSLFRVLITVLLGLISHLGVTYQMLIIRLACMLESTLVAPMEKLCLARFSSLPLLPLSVCQSIPPLSMLVYTISSYLIIVLLFFFFW